MTQTSTIPAFKAAFFAELKAALDGVQVTYGVPSGDQQDMVILGDTDGEQRWGAIGNYRREETYTLTLWISCLRPFGAQQSASEAAFGYLADVETLLRGNVTMNDTVRTCEVASPYRLSERARSADEREAQLQIGVYVTASLLTS